MSISMNHKIIIAIDGYSSCGKSTLARQLATHLSYTFIDSGAMYRAITLYFLRNNVIISDMEQVRNALQHINLSFYFNHDKQHSEIVLNGEHVASEIRGLEVAGKVSEVAAIRDVRTFAVVQQQKMGRHKGLVMDGRDIGTVVFPQAELKIFMTADPEVRVQRRYRELLPEKPGITMDEVRKNLEERDHIDTTRKESPLRRADDAILLDNSHMTREEQLELVLQWAKERIHLVQQ